MTSVSTNVKSIVPRPRVPEVLFSRDLTETAILGVGDPGAVSRVRRKGATKVLKHFRRAFFPSATDSCPWVSEDAETGNRA